MCYYLFFGALAGVLSVYLTSTIYQHTDWHPYLVIVAGLSATTFLMYGLDKFLAKADENQTRTPELIFHILALLGGFPGAWLGMLIWRHKTNRREHALLWLVLILSTGLHLLLAFYLFSRPGWRG